MYFVSARTKQLTSCGTMNSSTELFVKKNSQSQKLKYNFHIQNSMISEQFPNEQCTFIRMRLACFAQKYSC